MNATTELPEPMGSSLNSFITRKLNEYGWLPAGHDDEDVKLAIIKNLLEPRSKHFQGPIPAILVKEGTQIAVAEVLCTTLLKDTPPNDEKLLSFTRSLVDFYHVHCFNQSIWNGSLSLGFMGNGGIPSHDTLTKLRTGRRLSFFSLPPEIRNMIYKEHLISPKGRVVRSFTQPPLLQANRMIRDEAIPIFYSGNDFEITVKRTAEYERLAGITLIPSMPSVDMWAWHRFLRMWDVFNKNGSNCLQYVERITVIYQLSLDTGSVFGENEFDKRIGFRLSSKLFEEDLDQDYKMKSDSESDSDDSDDYSDVDPDELEAEVLALAEDDADERAGYQISNGNQGQDPEKDFDPVGVFELNRGSVECRSRLQTQHFIFYRVRRYATGQLWSTYPVRRLATMLLRCVRDCPRVQNNFDFLCEDYQRWMSGNRSVYSQYDPSEFYDPDEEEE
ncbi:hypothetical protein DHEL01_v212301 [Diaporthe helianthi]|uniref:Uncharacterized protein n=1 Tax=Diaporthe helianthi TaxID=158607 RepID=A0A2P5HGD5_DIAHE|nr:hypothetical protein DHEL01_v212301 [Diaporthe helianthi]